tara:strand:- start:1982 stop:2668 length:687 start_codon:yes stop_codon:yes gene_type:complete
MSRQKFQAVSFDAAGTLIHLSEPVGISYSRVAARFKVETDPNAVSSAFKRVWKRTPLPFSGESEVKDATEKPWWRRLVKEVFEEVGAEFPHQECFDHFFEALYDHFESPGTWVEDPDARATLEKVSSNHRTVILSNFDHRLRRILRDLDLHHYFESIFLSCELGASKPDRRIFEAVSKAMDLPPHSIVHVGDDPKCDWKGAKEAGFHHFRVGKHQQPLCELLRELSLA